jgi:AraC family transcriptional regulator of adaptative response/methylated-DNA-[protein]-cysteine methyltransferase
MMRPKRNGDTDDLRWKALTQRDHSQDGRWFYGVLTTGVYCKPSCAARRPRRENVRFYSSAEAAERDGLRACKRCKPDSPVTSDAADGIRKAVEYVKLRWDESPNLRELAVIAGMSLFHFQRTFKRMLGVTPKQYVDKLRIDSLKRNLKQETDIAASVYASGFGSGSRVYEKSNAELGMTPAQYRGGGRGINITYAFVPSPLGLMILGATGRGLCFLHFGEDRTALLAALRHEYPNATLKPMNKPYHPEFKQWIDALNEYMNGHDPMTNLPVDVRATAFQLRVWKYLQSIPRGEKRSYSQVAASIGSPNATRAVANACAANKLAIVIPCHRVIRNDGEPGEYRWGAERKRALLDREEAGGSR